MKTKDSSKTTRGERALDKHAKQQREQQKQADKVQALLDADNEAALAAKHSEASPAKGKGASESKGKGKGKGKGKHAPETIDKQNSAVAPTKGALGQLLGYSVISVMRAMGRAGWDFAKIKSTVSSHGIEAADRTIKGAIRRGRKGEMNIAPVTEEQLATL